MRPEEDNLEEGNSEGEPETSWEPEPNVERDETADDASGEPDETWG